MSKTRIANQLRKLANLQNERVISDIGPALKAHAEEGIIPKNLKIKAKIDLINDFFNEVKELSALPTLSPILKEKKS